MSELDESWTRCPGSRLPARILTRANDGLYECMCSVCAWMFVTAVSDPVIGTHYRNPERPGDAMFTEMPTMGASLGLDE